MKIAHELGDVVFEGGGVGDGEALGGGVGEGGEEGEGVVKAGPAVLGVEVGEDGVEGGPGLFCDPGVHRFSLRAEGACPVIGCQRVPFDHL